MATVRTIKLKISETAIRQAGGLEKAIRQRLERGAIVATEVLRGELARRSPVNTGTLANSFISRPPVTTEKGLKLSLGMIPYGQFVLNGHGGKGVRPPYDVIELWVKRRGIHRNFQTAPWMATLLPDRMKEKEGLSKRYAENKFTLAERLIIATLLVIGKIAKRGVEANDFFVPAMKFARPRMLRLLERSLTDK